MTSTRKPPAPSLSSVKSRFEKLYDEFGGPAPILDGVDRETLERACHRYEFEQVSPVIQKWSDSRSEQLRHWPWIALAAKQYAFERGQRSDFAIGPKPREIDYMLRRIQSDAKSLVESLEDLQKLSNAPDNPSAPLRSAHLAWIHEFLVQNAVLSPRADIDEIGEAMLEADFLGKRFINSLITLSAAAESAQERRDKKLLSRTRSSSDDSLHSLVGLCAKIWKSLTGRKASVHKVASKSRPDERPDFVLFVCDIARLTTGEEPTFDQVATGFHPRHRGKKNPE